MFGRGVATALLVGAGAAGARVALTAIRRSPAADALDRTNHRGHTVNLGEGPAAAIGASAAAAVGAGTPAHAGAVLTAGLVSGGLGLYDDVAGARPDQKSDKGLRGHLRALAKGRVSAGVVKIVGVSAAGLVSAVLLDTAKPSRGGRRGRAATTILGAGVIAGSANLVNLFDLRPGRALKVTSMVAGPLSRTQSTSALERTGANTAAATLGAASALLPVDLREEVMLGDCGANALGALLGVSVAARTGAVGRAAALTGITVLTLASEKVSFTKVIADTPVLRELDELGRKQHS